MRPGIERELTVPQRLRFAIDQDLRSCGIHLDAVHGYVIATSFKQLSDFIALRRCERTPWVNQGRFELSCSLHIASQLESSKAEAAPRASARVQIVRLAKK
jgi:hypothetical protein